MGTILEVRDLQVQFNTIEGRVHAVNNVSFSVKKGETLGIVGESGSGKSVSMMSLLRLIPEPPGDIVSGEAWLRDGPEEVDLLKLSRAQLSSVRGNRIGFVFQDPMSSLNPLLTVGEQIRESLERHRGLSKEAARRRAIELIDRVGIPDAKLRYGNYPHQFSGGMRQRVMIAIAISCEPALLIADEPTTALDVTVQAQIVELVDTLRKELQISVIWISHDLGVVAGIADRVAVMYGGSIVEVSDAETLFAHPRHPYTVGLLGALPKLQGGEGELVSIEGAPPNLFSPLRSCPFEPRCPWAFDRCRAERPKLIPVGEGHASACFYDLEHDRQRKARSLEEGTR